MWGLTFHSLVENTCMTSSFTKKELCDHKANFIYMHVWGIDVACFCDYSIWFWNCSDDVPFFVFHFIIYILPISDFFVTSWWWYAYISRFHFSLPVCLDQSFCTYSSICIYAILVLLVVFAPSMLVLSTFLKYNTWTLSLIGVYKNRW